MAAHKLRRRELFAKLAQPLYGFILFLPLCSDQRIIAMGFELKNTIYLD
jgi:hypothetical protein